MSLQSPGKGSFSKNILASFHNDTSQFHAYDVKRNSVGGGYVVSAIVTSSTGDPPAGVVDTPDIAKLTRKQLKGKRTGIVMFIREQSGFGTVEWAYRIFCLPDNAKIRIEVSDGGQILVAGSNIVNATVYRREIASFSKRGRLMYSVKYGNENSKYCDIALSSTELYILAIFDNPGSFRDNKVGMDRLIMTSGKLVNTLQLTPSKLPNNRVIKNERAFAIEVIFSGGVSRYVSLVRRQTANDQDQNYLTEDRLCSLPKDGADPIACFSVPTESMFSAESIFGLSTEYAYFAQFVSTGGSEIINMTRLSLRNLELNLGDWGNKPSTFELPPAEGTGARTRSNLAALNVLVDERGVNESVRILLTTSGTVNETATPLKARGRMAVIDFLRDGKVGSAFVDTSQSNPVRASSMAPLKRGTDQDAVVLGTITKSARGKVGQLYFSVFGDPQSGMRGKVDKEKPEEECIGHETVMNGISVRDVLRNSPGIRIQRHPLRMISRRKRIPMLCFKSGTKSQVCATPLHVMILAGRHIYMRDLCFQRGDCSISIQEPLNFKGECGAVLRVSHELEISMHAGRTSFVNAQQVVDEECEFRRKSYALWLLRTL